MTKPDLMAELAEVVRLLDDMQSWIGPRRPDARDAEEREQWDQIERAKTTIRTHHAELEAVVRKAARYDWIVERVEADEVDYMLPSVCRIDFKPGEELNGMHDSLDTAIDQAIAKEASHGLEE